MRQLPFFLKGGGLRSSTSKSNMKTPYQPGQFEKKWVESWKKDGLNVFDPDSNKKNITVSSNCPIPRATSISATGLLLPLPTFCPASKE